MTLLPREWRFLKTAWVYARIVTGCSRIATEKVLAALGATLLRHDVAFSRRRRRFLLARLHRDCAAVLPDSEPDTGVSMESFRKLSEPGRTGLLLLYLRLLPAEEIADVLGKSEKELPEILAAARSELECALETAP